MTLYLGVDYAKKFSVATLIDESGEIVKRSKLANERASFEVFLKGLKEKSEYQAFMKSRSRLRSLTSA